MDEACRLRNTGTMSALARPPRTIRRSPKVGKGDRLYFISCSFWLCLDAIKRPSSSYGLFIVVNAKIRPNRFELSLRNLCRQTRNFIANKL